MAVHVKLRTMRQHAARLVQPTVVRSELGRHLDFLYRQSLTDTDRRAKQEQLRECWYALVRASSRTKFIEYFRAQTGFLPEIYLFVGLDIRGEILSTPSQSPDEREPKHPDLSPEAFFRSLLNNALELPEELGHEKWTLVFGLRYLLLEARISREKRDPKGTSSVWSVLRVHCHKHGFLKPYAANELLQSKIRFFVRNDFGCFSRDKGVS